MKVKGMIVLIPLLAGYIMAGTTASAAAAVSYTAADAKILKGTDPDAVAGVLFKLGDLYAAKGSAAIKPAVPDLIVAAKYELSLAEDQRWNIYDIVKIMSLSGDARVQPMLLTFMSMIPGGGNPYTAQGFVAIGSATVAILADSLVSASAETRGRAAVTLHKMTGFAPKGFFTDAQTKTIRERLVKNLDHPEASVRIYSVVALRSFGDASVLSKLKNLETNDAHKDSGGTYEVRVEAAETLKQLGSGR